MKSFTPDAGKYRKISVYAKPYGAKGLVYLHSTNAYDTLAHAVIGTCLALEHGTEINKEYNYNEKAYYLMITNGFGHVRTRIDPYSIVAYFEE